MRQISYITYIITCFFIASCAGEANLSKTSNSLNEIGLLEKLNCEQTVRAYAHSRDQIDWQKNVALFTEDAVLQFRTLRLEGREQIKQALLDRGPKSFTRHIITSVSVTSNEEGNLSGTSYAVVYTADPNIDGPKPLTANSVEAILTYDDVFEVNERRCLISERTVTLDMVRKNEE